MAVPTLLYGSEIWTLGSKDMSRIQAAEMKFLRSIKSCTILDKIRNEDIPRELKIFCIKDKIQEYREDWLDHVQRMPHRGLPRASLYYTSLHIIYYIICLIIYFLHEEKETVEGPESVGLTRKPDQVYGLILEEEDDDDIYQCPLFTGTPHSQLPKLWMRAVFKQEITIATYLFHFKQRMQ